MTQLEKVQFVMGERENSKTFSEIAEELSAKCNKTYSRQYIHSLYKREIKRVYVKTNSLPRDVDICNVYVRVGSSVTLAQKALRVLGIDETYYSLRKVIMDNEQTIKCIDCDLLDRVIEGLYENDSKEDIAVRLYYKIIPCYENKVSELFVDAYINIIEEDIKERIRECGTFVEDVKKIKGINDRFKIDDTVNSILKG